MQRRTDILIVGGGIVGLTIAYYASAAGLGDVTLIERNSIGRGASSRNRGGIRAQFSNQPMTDIMRSSVEIWETLSEELNWNLLFDQRGYLMVARNEAQLEEVKERVKLQNRSGVESEVLSAEEVFEMVPSLSSSSGVLGASFNQRDGTVHHDAVLWGFERAARRRGVEILEGVDCKSITLSSGRATGVETSAGDIKAEKIVNAAGIHTKDIAETIGLILPIRSFRRETMVTEPYKSFMRPVFWDLTLNLVLSQTLHGEIQCGTRDPNSEESRDLDATYAYLKKLAKEILELFPVLGSVNVLRHWAGHYDVTPDGSPLLGEADHFEDVFVAAGFSGHGFMLAPVVGKLYSEMFASGKTPALLEPFRLARFAEGNPIRETLVSGRRIA